MKDLLKFSPLIVLYFLLVLTRGQSALFGDEIRYFAYAENLTQGFYSPTDNPNLINGPGYPLYLAAFVALNLPPLAPKIISAVLFFLAIIFFYKSLLFYIPKRSATLFAYALGLYWPMLIRLQWNNTEPLALFLLCGLIYFIIKTIRAPKNKIIHIILAAMMVGYLALTRDIFFYVILVSLILSLAYFLITKNKWGLIWALTMGLGFLVVLPYLVYTHSLTGRPFYFSSNGGEQLYWMSSSLPGEFGSFISIDSIYERKGPEVDAVHVQFIDSIFQLPYVERNDALISRAKENILENPKGYMKNIIANILRLVGHGPSSFENQVWATYKYLFTHFLLLAPFLLSLIPAWLHRRSIPPEIFFLSLFILIYLGGSILVAAISRYFVLAIPFILLWLAFFYTHTIQFSFVYKWKNNGTK